MIAITVGLAAAMAIFSFASLAEYLYTKSHRYEPLVFFILCLVLSAWSIASITTPFKHTDYIVCSVQEATLPNNIGTVQQIVWVENRETRTLNVNEFFRCTFKVGDKVTVITHPAAWYYGIHWAAQREFVAGEVKPD